MTSGYKYIKSSPERLEKERERVKNINNNRYKTDENYRNRVKENAKLYYQNKKNDIKITLDYNLINA